MKKILPIFAGILAVIALFVFRQAIFYKEDKMARDIVKEWLEEREKKTVYCNVSVTYRTKNDSSVTFFLHKRDHALENNYHGLNSTNYNFAVPGPFDIDSIILQKYENKDTFALCDECFADTANQEVAEWIKEKGKIANVKRIHLDTKY